MENQMVVYGDNNVAYVEKEFDVSGLMESEQNYVKIFANGFDIDDVDLFNSVQSPDKPVSECIGDSFNLCGVIAHPVQVIDQNTGELTPAPRIILIGSKGESYVSVSKTMYSSLKNLFALYKQPGEWGNVGIPIKLRQAQKNNKRYFSIEIIKEKKGK